MSERLVVRGGFVVSMDPEIGEIPNADVLVEDGKIVEIGPKLDVARCRGDRRVREARAAGLHRHAPAHVADAGARCAPVLHPRRLLRRHAREDRAQLPARGRLHRELRRLARGAQRRDHDAARLVAHLEHARALRRGGARAPGRRHPRRLRPRHPGRQQLVGVQRPGPSRRHQAHPRAVLLLRRPAAHARDGRPRGRERHARDRAARLGAGARARHPDHRPRRHAPDGHPRPPHPRHARGRGHGAGHDLHPLHGLDRRGARPDRRDRRHRLDRVVRRAADGTRPAADRPSARARRAAVALGRRRLQRPGRDVHPDAHGARLRADPGVHRHARRAVRADADAPRRARVRDDRGRPGVRPRPQGRLAHPREAGGLHPPAHRHGQRRAADRPGHDRGRLRRHVERRLGVRRGQGGEAERRARRPRPRAGLRPARAVARLPPHGGGDAAGLGCRRLLRSRAHRERSRRRRRAPSA